VSKNLMRVFPVHRLIATVLLVCFATLTGFPTALHAHEWDGGLANGDCAPCHFTQHSTCIETPTPFAGLTPRVEPFSAKSVELHGAHHRPLESSRSPPAGF